MRDEDDKPAIAVIDTIRFASGDNPLSEISLQTGRGAHLNKEPSEEDWFLHLLEKGEASPSLL